MACNVPVIGSDVAAIPEYVIPNETGELLKDHDDVAEMRDAIKKCVEQYDKYSPRELVVEKYSRQSVVAGYRQVLYLNPYATGN